MIQLLESLLVRIDTALKWLITILFGGMATIIFLQVIYRYVFKSPLPWSEELARFLFIWVTFLGGAMAARRGSHIGVELLANKLNIKARKALNFTTSMLTAGFFGIIAYVALSVFDKLMSQTSPAMELPIGYPYLGMIIGSALMCVCYVLHAFSGLAPGQEEDV